VAKSPKSSVASGKKSATKKSHTREAASGANGFSVNSASAGVHSAQGKSVYMTDIAVALLDPPDVLARPINDEYLLTDLIPSLRSLGQIDPVIVTPNGVRYKIVDGMHRYTAARELQWAKLRAQVFTDEHVAVEAIQLHTCQVHKEMTAWEEHVFYKHLCERLGMEFLQVCEFTRKSEDYVSVRLNIANLTLETQRALQNDRINLGVVRELMRIDDPLWERYFLDQCLINGCGAKVLHGWITKWKLEKMPLTQSQIDQAKMPPPAPPEVFETLCSLCAQPSRGRAMVQVMVHHDELMSLSQAIQAQDRARAAAEPAAAPGAEGK
jgi:ParB family transcriptional regulator, chromosome partitioning protein